MCVVWALGCLFRSDTRTIVEWRVLLWVWVSVLCLCTQHWCRTEHFTCIVQPRSVGLWLHGSSAYIDNVGFKDSGALRERLILFICGSARLKYKVVKYIMLLISLNSKNKMIIRMLVRFTNSILYTNLRAGSLCVEGCRQRWKSVSQFQRGCIWTSRLFRAWYLFEIVL